MLASLDGARTTTAGVSVSEEGSLRNTAVLACVRILANSVAMLPLPVYRRLSPHGKERAPEHPLYAVLQEQANPEMTAFELRRWLMQSVLLWGNGYAEIEWSDAGTVMALWPLRPDRWRSSDATARWSTTTRCPPAASSGCRSGRCCTCAA